MAVNRLVPLTTATVVAAAVLVGGTSLVATAAVSSGAVKVCTTKKGVVVSASKKSRCPKGTKKKRVAVQGARGPAGARGPVGAPGTATAWALISGSTLQASSTNVKSVSRPESGVVCVAFTRPIPVGRLNAAVVQTADRVTDATVPDPFSTRTPCAGGELTISVWTVPGATGLASGVLRVVVP